MSFMDARTSSEENDTDLHDDSSLCLPCTYVVQGEGPVGTYTCKNGCFREIEADGSDSLGGGGESEIGNGGAPEGIHNSYSCNNAEN